MMFSVSPEIYQKVLAPASRYLFAFFALMLLFFALAWLRDERRKRRERFRSLPEAGNVGEMVVISGSDRLPVDTWFPVPREGILGSLRSCDLVVPCPGVRARHLSFSWQDGTGLVIRPFPGCETFVDGVPLLTADKAEMPVMVHGSCLQVGDTVLRLQLLSALEHTNRPFTVSAPAQDNADGLAAQQPLPYAPFPQETVPRFDSPVQENTPPVFVPEQLPGAAPDSFSSVPDQSAGFVSMPDQSGGFVPVSDHPVVPAASSNPTGTGEQPSPRRRRADRWKEDFSE